MAADDSTIETARAHMIETLAGFTADPPDSDYLDGFQHALFIFAREGLGMTPENGLPEPPPGLRPTQLRPAA